MNKETLIKFFLHRKVYLTVVAVVMLAVLILGFGMTLEQAKETIENIWKWTQGF